MLQAMNTGHDGSLTTIHANDTRDALGRLEMMVGMAGFDLPIWVIRRQIASAIHIIVQVGRLPGGARKVVKISEITGMEGDDMSMHDLFALQADRRGRATGGPRAISTPPASGRTAWSGWRPCGLDLPVEMFERRILSPQGGVGGRIVRTGAGADLLGRQHVASLAGGCVVVRGSLPRPDCGRSKRLSHGNAPNASRESRPSSLFKEQRFRPGRDNPAPRRTPAGSSVGASDRAGDLPRSAPRSRQSRPYARGRSAGGARLRDWRCTWPAFASRRVCSLGRRRRWRRRWPSSRWLAAAGLRWLAVAGLPGRR